MTYKDSYIAVMLIACYWSALDQERINYILCHGTIGHKYFQCLQSPSCTPGHQNWPDSDLKETMLMVGSPIWGTNLIMCVCVCEKEKEAWRSEWRSWWVDDLILGSSCSQFRWSRIKDGSMCDDVLLRKGYLSSRYVWVPISILILIWSPDRTVKVESYHQK